MAVKWAVANGNWSTGATWNDGVVPAVGDDVYLDNHIITIDVDVTLGNGTISNGQNPNTTLSGGSLTMSATYTIVANLDAFAGMINSSGSGARNFVGNITLHGNSTFINQSTNNTISLSITGNVTTEGGTFIQRSSAGASIFNVTINGNISIVNTTLYSSRYTGEKNLVINGNLSLANGGITVQDVYLTTFILSGSLSNIYGRNVLAVDAEVSGNITYASATGGMGIFANSLTINNPDTFTWKDVTEPRSNPFIILTDAEMNNHQQYPPENKVKEGTEYVWGEKVGTYQQPPESVVLKDYVYDNDEKIGTLEIPQVPTTSDIVTAIKNDSDLGDKINTTNTNVGNISTAVTTIDGKVDIIDTNVDTLLSRLTSVLTQRLGQSVTVEILQQILVAHLDN